MIDLPYPLSVNRYWTISAKGRSIIPTEAGRKWKRDAQLLARSQWKGAPLKGDVKVSMIFHPKEFQRNGRKAGSRLDIDNVLKVGLDSIQGVCFENDAQIVELFISIGDKRPHGGLAVQAMEAG